MTLHRLPDGSARLAHLDDWHLQTLRRIPELSDPGDDEQALRRLYPAPFAPGDATEEQIQDWDEFVRPDVEELFRTSVERVAADLQTAAPEPRDTPVDEANELSTHVDEEPIPPPKKRARRKSPPQPLWSVVVPSGHVEDWYRAMNQVRLMLSEKYDAHRTDNEHIVGMFMSGRMDILVQYELFGRLCDWWLAALMKP